MATFIPPDLWKRIGPRYYKDLDTLLKELIGGFPVCALGDIPMLSLFAVKDGVYTPIQGTLSDLTGKTVREMGLGTTERGEVDYNIYRGSIQHRYQTPIVPTNRGVHTFSMVLDGEFSKWMCAPQDVNRVTTLLENHPISVKYLAYKQIYVATTLMQCKGTAFCTVGPPPPKAADTTTVWVGFQGVRFDIVQGRATKVQYTH